MDVKLDKVYEVNQVAVCGYPGGSHRPRDTWVFESLAGGSWKVLQTYKYDDWTVGNCFADKRYKKALQIPKSRIVAAQEFRVRSTSYWTNNHMLMFNWGIWGCEGKCSSGGEATLNVDKIVVSVVDQHVGLADIIELLLAQQMATAQTAVQAAYLALAQGSREELDGGSCEAGTPDNVFTRDKMNAFGWSASSTCGGIGGNPKHLSDNTKRTSTSSWTSYGFQQRCCGTCWIEVDFKSDHYTFCAFGLFGYPGGSHKPNNKWAIQGYAAGTWRNLVTENSNSRWVTNVGSNGGGTWPIQEQHHMAVDAGMGTVPVTKVRIIGSSFTNAHMLAFNFAGFGHKKK
jgi:hypothetical protein